MLQLIGWLGCVYLLVKGLELVSTTDERASGAAKAISGIAAGIALLASLGFFLLFTFQTSGLGDQLSQY